jgi:hypothetical protein
MEQKHLFDMVRNGQGKNAFSEAFDTGNAFFETTFVPSEGVGANVGDGNLFSPVPRADLDEPGQWATHIPSRATGPNAASCLACHFEPTEDGASATNELRDPFHTGDSEQFITRNTTPLFGLGGLQRLGEEMTDALQDGLRQAKVRACRTAARVTQQLWAKGVSYGFAVVTPVTRPGRAGGSPTCRADVDLSGLQGVDRDLVVKPFQWKGSVASLRDFSRGAAHQELGMQAIELVGEGKDGDFDGIVNEVGIGDVTSLAVYMAAQPRPTTKVELAYWGLTPKLERDEMNSIKQGAAIFKQVGCASCHVPRLDVNHPVYSEPSLNSYFRDPMFPSGQDPLQMYLDYKYPISFNLTHDQPDNHLIDDLGFTYFRLGAFERSVSGHAIVRLYSDLKRHEMGAELAEAIDETGVGKSVFLTRPLWGVGSTAPYLHDGRAPTLEAAILAHGGEAAASRSRFAALAAVRKKDLVAFLSNQVLFKTPEDEGRRVSGF